MSRRRGPRRFSIGKQKPRLSDSADYWPLTITPSGSATKRGAPWKAILTLLLLLAAIGVAIAR
jgi:hypothetical protein